MLEDTKLSRLHQAHADVLTRVGARRIGSAPLFAGASSENQELLAATARLIHLDDGQIVITEGDLTTAAYFIWSGTVHIENSDGETLARVQAGELVGEVVAAAVTPTYRFERTATVRAVGPVDLYMIPAASLRRLMEAEPVVRDRIRALIEERISLEQRERHLKGS